VTRIKNCGTIRPEMRQANLRIKFLSTELDAGRSLIR
jgi:hypothetical protein